MGVLCGSEYAEENAQVFVGGEGSVSGQGVCTLSRCQDVRAHACRCIRDCVCIFTCAGMRVCTQVCAHAWLAAVLLWLPMIGMQMQIICK